MNKPIYILAIESSCDDTSAAVLKDTEVLSNLIANQQVHELYGGVVPELASRAHQKNIVPVVQQAVAKAGIQLSDLSAIAFTSGPGLLGSLLVGGAFAKSMALALGIPLISVHHMRAHILAHFIKHPEQKPPAFPFLCLTVSGGHTQIVKVSDYHQFEIIGQTIDDAAGEAFDKLAKMLNLPYPGGPEIDKLAKLGNPEAFEFAKPNIPNLDFSFSGLKTSFLYFMQKEMRNDPNFIAKNLNDICASAQKAIVSILVNKLQKAAQTTGIQSIAIAGGVSANSELRRQLQVLSDQNGYTLHMPAFEFTTDNAAMIGIAAHFQFLAKEFAPLNIPIEARKEEKV
jgi:N6-L-threonylcarbamoyladenine synthase